LKEQFQPISNTRDESVIGYFKFYGRMLLDFQILTIFKDIRKQLPYYSGNILDIGCGQSPYRFLLNSENTKYFGIDIVDAEKFDYFNEQIIPFDGLNIPFENESMNHIICTEVLEHVEKYQELVNEIYRTMKTGATGIITVPFSARYHYIPWDYFRYTPSSLKTIFQNFSSVDISPRGTDISVIGNKLVVLFFRNLIPKNIFKFILLPLWILLLPVLAVYILIAHISLIFNLGSEIDPLGYTIIIKK